MTQNLKHLGNKTEYVYTNPTVEILEHVPNPFSDREQNRHQVAGTVHIEANEFTSLCPITGQPDFATIVIDYIPRERLVESKSLKLYLGSFRQFGEFHESCVNRIANDLIELLDPSYIKVEGQFTPRGGISIWPVAEFHR
ncbi:MAG: preQ(1) synthase [Candidatus Obscuribacterales bacterium]